MPLLSVCTECKHCIRAIKFLLNCGGNVQVLGVAVGIAPRPPVPGRDVEIAITAKQQLKAQPCNKSFNYLRGFQ